MADFNEPRNVTLYSLVLDKIKESILSCVTLFDGTTDSNIPDKAKRYNTSNDKFEKYAASGGTWSPLPFHTAIDNHIADTALHSGVPTGAYFPYAGSTAPTGYLLCQGQAVSRTTYAALFAALGGVSTPWGVGDGSTTFNVPDLRTRFPLGRATSGGYSTLGATGGAIDHTHTTPNHTHTITGHTHTMAHTHTLNDHTHVGPSHTHTIGAHSHDVKASGGNIAIAASGAHSHAIPAWQNAGAFGANGQLGRANTLTGGSRADSLTEFPDVSQPTHTHPTSSFSGRVGATSGADGDAGFASGSSGNSNTSGVNGGAGSTNGSSAANTGDSGTLTTASGGGSTSGTANPPYIISNYIIKT